jgi:hypothetical protein
MKGYKIKLNPGQIPGIWSRGSFHPLETIARRKRNVVAGFWRGGVFHPIRASEDYDPEEVGEPEHWTGLRLLTWEDKRAGRRSRLISEHPAARGRSRSRSRRR